MPSLDELYQNVILEHNRSPRNYRAMPDADGRAEGNNPLCGDQVTVFVRMDGDVIGDVSFQGAGCAISRASASLMTGAVKGKTRAETDALFNRFRRLVTGTLTVFFDVANQSYLPAIVERDQLVEGNAKLQVSQSAAEIAGPGVAGYLVSIVQAPFAILLDALSFVASAFFIFLIRRPEPPVVREVDDAGRPKGSLVEEVRQGLGFVLGNSSLRAIAAASATFNLASYVLFSIYILYAVNELHLAAATIGIVVAIGNIGTLIGAVLANRLARWLGIGPTIIGSIFITSFVGVLVAIAPPGDAAIPFLVGSGMVGGVGRMVYTINQVSYRQAICPPRMQGRMNATVRFLVWGTIPIGNILGGVIATTFGVHETIWLAAVLGFVPAIFPLLSPVRSLREMPKPIGDEPSTPSPTAPPAPTPTPA
jgi:SUF system NifU family Fe-S assembly protein